MRSDLEMIDEWVQPNIRVLDLACGPGELLHHLIQNKQVKGYGLEIGPDDLNTCIEKGIPVLEQNIDEGLQNFDDQSFDLVLMTHALQQFRRPDLLIDEMLRIGKECIITFPNFGHWRSRLHLALKGRMPVSDFLPYNWYDTPNIHFFTFQDFERLCREKDIKILRWAAVDGQLKDHWWIRSMPNLFSETAIFHISR
ncbi:methionine biosynthesis protein MetW [Marinomonas sp. A3A]|jgi:methionine biosynthesis protein MetW|uniref:Methionine biosynthesis protein MetW n=1 Tax=Marinomonas polaris DSM 16579 TaxID=1122206 RepID=A0A1M5B9W4_9GAMM|nr:MULTISPECIES: methionine biosynthesis protein MetW [Marinomonas]MBU1293910.1 methionine biosynthesis protein MetW [Gammaproteobacteria bacterium]MBU1465783.1 methionine biosynthesis protein MetW [Gammaproteobacteria bacterium]MBU2023384.1 methionine biosynthesis protein MetW [Gammaproteobacteria bacterium]MBU2240124.1 methionine biosynthesis protein MetW [Gammaproteobacteria bacterium]MBU2413542.1 methionine biosynthesis protein MetW [Gammaproteobacteria bacterium]|tara:strand:+ start:36481 stop:37071 length:591 start_codon:yes stop_codon:yes gene_type:complete